MAMFKFLNTNKKMMILVIILFSINYSNQQNCYYSDNLTDYLTGNDNNELKHKCFSLSNNFENEKCCYNTDKNLCYKEKYLNDPTDGVDEDRNKFECPEKGLVPNNCGMAGIYQPLLNHTCIDISLVQGYCCYIEYKIKDETGTACIRAKKLKKKDETPDDIIQFINLFENKGIEVIKADCGNTNIKFYWIYSLILYIFFIIL